MVAKYKVKPDESRELIEQALNRKGDMLNMCKALDELKQKGIEQGIE